MTVAAKSKSSSYAASFKQPSWSASRRAKRKVRMLWITIGRLSVDRTSARLASTSGPVGSARMSSMPKT
jgi:hypothetical protein